MGQRVSGNEMLALMLTTLILLKSEKLELVAIVVMSWKKLVIILQNSI
jgi:hypothetical protein